MKQFTLDITAEHCPMTFVKAKLELEKLEPGDTLEVILKGEEPLENVPRSAGEQGFSVLDITPAENDVYHVLIEK